MGDGNCCDFASAFACTHCGPLLIFEPARFPAGLLDGWCHFSRRHRKSSVAASQAGRTTNFRTNLERTVTVEARQLLLIYLRLGIKVTLLQLKMLRFSLVLYLVSGMPL